MNSITTDNEQDFRQTLKAACADIVREEADEFRKCDTAGVTFDRHYRSRRNRTIRQSRRRISYRAYTILSRVAVFLLVIFAASSITVLGVSAERHVDWTAVMDWQEDFVMVSFVPESQTQETTTSEEKLTPMFSPSSASDAETGQVPDEIKYYFEPTALPEYTEKRVQYQSNSKYAVEYYVDGNYYCSYRLNVLSGSVGLDIEDAIITEVDVNGNTAYLFQYDSPKKQTIQIIWTDGAYEYYLHTFDHCMGVETLMEIAKSIR